MNEGRILGIGLGVELGEMREGERIKHYSQVSGSGQWVDGRALR